MKRILFGMLLCAAALSASAALRLAPPPSGRLYHGVYPGGVTGEEDDITGADIHAYTSRVGQAVAWVTFSHNWYKGRAFPGAMCRMIRKRGAVPYVRLMMRSDPVQNHADPVFTLPAIINGDFDSDLRAWGQAAAAFQTPILVEWGGECNGNWEPWNGRWYGKGATNGFGDPGVADGPERFVATYRHIVKVIRKAGASNVSFVWHVNGWDVPERAWNRLENYYPGDDVVDWIGVSAYGALTPADPWAIQFITTMDAVYPRLAALTPDKPMLVAEFGCSAGNPAFTPDVWANKALRRLLEGRWPRVAGFSWWNEWWQNDDDPAHDTTMRVQDLPLLADVFKTQLATHRDKLRTKPKIVETP